MLTDIIPASARKVVYGIFGAVGLVLAALQAAFLAQHTEPVWLVMALAAYGVASAGVHATAGANTPAPKRNQKGEVTLSWSLVIAVVLLLAFLFGWGVLH